MPRRAASPPKGCHTDSLTVDQNDTVLEMVKNCCSRHKITYQDGTTEAQFDGEPVLMDETMLHLKCKMKDTDVLLFISSRNQRYQHFLVQLPVKPKHSDASESSASSTGTQVPVEETQVSTLQATARPIAKQVTSYLRMILPNQCLICLTKVQLLPSPLSYRGYAGVHSRIT